MIRLPRIKKVRVKTAAARSKSSAQWLKRQLNDPYVLQSQKDGYVSRSAYKLLEIDEKFSIFKSGQVVVDLGAAPGGWIQVAAKKLSSLDKSLMIGIDLLPLNINTADYGKNIKFIQGDFTAQDIQDQLKESLDGRLINVIMSDMAANTIGNRDVDHLRIMVLLEEAYGFACQFLQKGGVFIGKIFQGGTHQELLNQLKKDFATVKHFKPKSSRKESSEFYVVAMSFK